MFLDLLDKLSYNFLMTRVPVRDGCYKMPTTQLKLDQKCVAIT